MTDTNPESKPLVLVVDDDQFMQSIFKDTLEKGGFRTATACNGVQALAKFNQMQPDLVLLDLIMPQRDGFETCRDIRRLPEGRHTPVLVVTGLDNSELVHRAFDCGATDFIVKSINPDLLVYRARCLLRNGRLMKTLQQSEDRLARVQQIARLGDWEWNPEDGAFWASDELFQILDASPELPPTLDSFLSLVAPADRDMVRATLKRALAGLGCDFECRIVRGDGAERLVWVFGRLENGGRPGPGCLIGTLQDVTELRRTENRSRMLKEAVDSLQIGITFSDANGRIAYLNPAEARMHGYEVEELIGREAREFAAKNLRRQGSPARRQQSCGSCWRNSAPGFTTCR